nr:vgr related protein [Novosphingobium marinum]
MVRSVFGTAIDCGPVRIKRRRWFPFQPRDTLMAPTGHIHFHPGTDLYCDDFADAPLPRQGLFLHEMTHVWQAQRKGRWYLPLMRHPFCRYHYSLKPGWKLERYGIEQQAEIVRHAFLLRNGWKLAGAPDPAAYDMLVDFPGVTLA